MHDDTLLEMLLTIERGALDRWSRGDTGGYAAMLDDEVTYFDHVTPARLQGRSAVVQHLRNFDGMMNIPRHDIVNPAIHHDGDIAMLAFNWDPKDADGKLIMRWNATSVYRRVDGQWRVVHAHWAMAAKD